MTLDTLLRGVEQRLAGQSELLELGHTWMEKTKGLVSAEIKFQAQDYINLLTSIPLIGEIKSEIATYSRLLQTKALRRHNPRGHLARMLIYFPRIINTINHVVQHDSYSDGMAHASLGSPFTLTQILRNYVASGNGEMRRFRGDCRSVEMALNAGYLDEDTILRTTGLRQTWDSYQSKRKLPPAVAEKIKRTLQHFLENTHYSAGNGRHGAIGQPLPLRGVLRNYIAEGKGRLTTSDESSGNCSGIYIALFKGDVTEEMIWEATRMEGEWKKYQESTGLPSEITEQITVTLGVFLQEPLYSRGCAAYGAVGNPLPLMSVLRSYIAASGDIQSNKGDCRAVWDGLVRKRITLDMIWAEVPLREEWQAYSQTTAAQPFQWRPA